MSQKDNSRRLSLPTLLLALAVISNLALPVTGGAAPPIPGAQTISIAEARSLPLGSVVTVDGSLTVQSGAFSSSTFDQGFAIQDHTGGIYVSVADDLELAPRQQVRVTGQLADSFGLLVLTSVTDIKTHGNGPKVQPLPVATGAVSEATEGKLVRITGIISRPILDDLPFGFMIFINDGSGEVHSFVSTSTGIDVSGLQQGQTIEITGFSGQFDESYEVDPRFQADIKVVS